MTNMTVTLRQPLTGSLKGFSHFWLKRVHGFDSSQHCARCLVGYYSKAVGRNMQADQTQALEDLQPGEIWYMCGVSNPYVWHKNFHLAFKFSGNPNDLLIARLWTGGQIELGGAEQVEFDGQQAVKDYPNRGSAYLTCRNFQFGAHIWRTDQAVQSIALGGNPNGFHSG